MKEEKKGKETDTELLARLMAGGFKQMDEQFKQVNERLSDIDSDLIEVNDRLLHLEKGQLDIYRNLDVIGRKQAGMMLSLDEAAHQKQVNMLELRVGVLEAKVLKGIA